MEDQPEHYPGYEPTHDEYTAKVKQLCASFGAELYDLSVRFNCSLLGELERNGMLTAGDDLINAAAKIELLKEII